MGIGLTVLSLILLVGWIILSGYSGPGGSAAAPVCTIGGTVICSYGAYNSRCGWPVYEELVGAIGSLGYIVIGIAMMMKHKITTAKHTTWLNKAKFIVCIIGVMASLGGIALLFLDGCNNKEI